MFMLIFVFQFFTVSFYRVIFFPLFNPLLKPNESHNVNCLFPENMGYSCLFHAAKSISCMANNKITDSETLQQEIRQDAARDNSCNVL